MFTITTTVKTYIKSTTASAGSQLPFGATVFTGTLKTDFVFRKDKHYGFNYNGVIRFIYCDHAIVKSHDIKSALPENYPLLSQRLFTGDYNFDGKPDAFQTCNVHSVACVVEGLTGKEANPLEHLKRIQANKGSIYNHGDLVKELGRCGLKSVFSTETPMTAIQNHIASGNPAILSFRVTHGGHIVTLVAYDPAKKAYLVLDSYGEPSKKGGKWSYDPKPTPYWLSESAILSLSFSEKQGNSWAHLVSK